MSDQVCGTKMWIQSRQCQVSLDPPTFVPAPCMEYIPCLPKESGWGWILLYVVIGIICLGGVVLGLKMCLKIIQRHHQSGQDEAPKDVLETDVEASAPYEDLTLPV